MGLTGNRAIGTESPTAWGVVIAMGRAFPLLLDKPIQRAKIAAAACEDGSKDGGSECILWANEVCWPCCSATQYLMMTHIVFMYRLSYTAWKEPSY